MSDVCVGLSLAMLEDIPGSFGGKKEGLCVHLPFCLVRLVYVLHLFSVS